MLRGSKSKKSESNLHAALAERTRKTALDGREREARRASDCRIGAVVHMNLQ